MASRLVESALLLHQHAWALKREQNTATLGLVWWFGSRKLPGKRGRSSGAREAQFVIAIVTVGLAAGGTVIEVNTTGVWSLAVTPLGTIACTK